MKGIFVVYRPTVLALFCILCWFVAVLSFFSQISKILASLTILTISTNSGRCARKWHFLDDHAPSPSRKIQEILAIASIFLPCRHFARLFQMLLARHSHYYQNHNNQIVISDAPLQLPGNLYADVSKFVDIFFFSI